LEKFCGTFQFSNTKFSIIQKEGKLFKISEDEPQFELIPESETKLFLSDLMDRQIEFTFSNAGTIQKVSMINCGLVTNGTLLNN